MNLSQTLQTYIVNYLNGAAFPASPAELQVVLSSTDPAIGVTSVGSAPLTLVVSPDGTATNSGPVSIPSAAGSFLYLAIAADGQIMVSAPVAFPRVLTAGISFAANDINISFSGALSTTFATQVLEWMVGTALPAAPTQLYAGVGRATNNIVTQPSTVSGYAKRLVTFDAPVYVAGVGTTLTSNIPVIVGPATDNSWGVPTHLLIIDNTDRVLLQAAMQPSVPQLEITTGLAVGFATAQISILVE